MHSCCLYIAATMHYHRFKTVDLVQCARQRNITVTSTTKDTANGPTRADYIRALKEADKHVTFDFLGLTPEMRNMVYEELLVIGKKGHCYPQILATCKQIQKEATSELYNDNWLVVKIGWQGVKLLTQAQAQWCLHPLETPRDIAGIEWPAVLRKFGYVEIHAAFNEGKAMRTDHMQNQEVILNNVLYSMASFLRSTGALRRIDIYTNEPTIECIVKPGNGRRIRVGLDDLSGGGQPDPEYKRRALDPLQLFKAEALVIKSSTSTDIFEGTTRYTGSSGSTTLRGICLSTVVPIIHEAQNIEQLMRILRTQGVVRPAGFSGRWATFEASGLAGKLLKRLSRVDRLILSKRYFDNLWESEMETCVKRLEQTLDLLDSRVLEQLRRFESQYGGSYGMDQQSWALMLNEFETSRERRQDAHDVDEVAQWLTELNLEQV